ncbi:hypothetical protein Tco_0042492 [Tanacetum coccineum]
MHDRKLDLRHLHVFGALCYPTKDSEALGMLKPKADIADTTGTASSTIIDQDAPYVSTLPTLGKFKLPLFIKVLKKKFKEFKMHNLIMHLLSIILLQTRVLKNHPHKVSFHQICISSTNRLVISVSRQRISYWRMSLEILLDLFRQEVNSKPMPYGVTLMHMDILFHLLENGLNELYSLKHLAEDEEE